MKLNLLIGLILVSSSFAHAEEGMWLFNRMPHATLQQQYGFDATPEWLSHLMHSSVRLNSGGSGSFVSADGLLLTNHHVAASSLQQASSPGHDYYEDGFYARSLAEEIPIPTLEVNVLVSVDEVTGQVNAAVTPDMTPGQALLVRRAAIARIEVESLASSGLRSDVVALYGGRIYDLYRYKKYTDIRIAFAPEFKIAFFGGDPDNFEYPRYDLDMSLLRVYENGQPARVTQYLRWSATGAAADDLVFVSGNPGATDRIKTVAALESARDAELSYTLDLLHRREALMRRYSARGVEQARQAKGTFFSLQNSRKVYEARLAGLQQESILGLKRQAEAQLRAQVAANPSLQPTAGAWDQIAAARQAYRGVLREASLFSSGSAFYTGLFGTARTLVRMADEFAKPDDQRLPEFHEAGLASLRQNLFSTAPIYDEFEAFKLADSLTMLTEMIPAVHELYPLVQQVLAGKSPQARAEELVSATRIKDVAERRRLAEEGREAIAASQDPMILLAKLVDETARRLRRQIEEQVEGPEATAYPQIAAALFATQGTGQYPDATFTPRLSYGRVLGYQAGGQAIAAATTIGGAFEHEAAHGAVDPYQLPASWHAHERELNRNVPLNFVSTNDIIGGNSGSPVINRAGELVGLIFDGNRESLVGDYVYDGIQNRAVSVHSAGMIEAMRSVYHADALVQELLQGQRVVGVAAGLGR